MELPITMFENTNEAAHAIFDYINKWPSSRFKNKLTLRPYNRFEPTFSEWWLYPLKGDWPAYSHGKLFFHNTDDIIPNDSLLYLGYYVEKGLSENLIDLSYVKKNNIMKRGWFWHRFIDLLENGDIDKCVQRVFNSSKYPIIIRINAYPFNSVPEPDKEQPEMYDSAIFKFDLIGGKFNVIKSGREVLKDIMLKGNFSELASQLKNNSNLQFYWVCVKIGILLRYGNPKSFDWGPSDIWKNILEPFANFVE